jgi:tRNA pseudouridine38-40 synthase
LEEAVKKFVGADNCTRISTSSRTDTGVHAIRNVCHVDMIRRKRQSGDAEPPHTARTVHRALNHHLSHSCRAHDIAVTDVEMVDMDSFHARFSATGRTYTYRILARVTPGAPAHSPVFRGDADAPAFPLSERRRAWCVPEPLNIQAMREAASGLLGHHDFSSFRGARCQANSPIRTIDGIQIESAHIGATSLFPGGKPPNAGANAAAPAVASAAELARAVGAVGAASGAVGAVDSGSNSAYYSPSLLCLHPQELELVTVTIHARSYLYHMVRNLVGTLYSAGSGHLSSSDVHAILEAKNRCKAPKMAPAHGLYLGEEMRMHTVADSAHTVADNSAHSHSPVQHASPLAYSNLTCSYVCLPMHLACTSNASSGCTLRPKREPTPHRRLQGREVRCQ